MTPAPPQPSRDTRDIQSDARKLNILLGLSRALAEEIHLDSLLALMVDEVTRAMEAERTSLLLYDEHSGELWSKLAQGLEIVEIRIPIGVGIAGTTAKTRSSINIADAYNDARFNPEIDRRTGFRTRSILAMPILHRDGRLLGVVEVLNKSGGVVFTAEDEEFLSVITTHLALALERAELVKSYVQAQKFQQSLQLARHIQLGLVPQAFSALRSEIDIFGTLIPALEVGGDLYDFFPLDGDRICFVIGDVSDKGIAAALFMAIVRTAFRMSALRGGASMAETLGHVNRFLSENNESQMFVTMFAGTLDLRTGKIQYSDGGHEPPFILRRSGAAILEKNGGLALGVMPDYEFTPGTIELARGDCLLLYTDGVNEARDMQNRMFSVPGIQQSLRPLDETVTAEQVVNGLMQKLNAFTAGAPQSDDITVLAIKYAGRDS